MSKHEPVSIKQTEVYKVSEIELKKFLAGVTDIAYDPIRNATITDAWVTSSTAEIVFTVTIPLKTEPIDPDQPF
jgi:hypothetical protein